MSNSNEKYFDLHIDGIGYLNRAREVAVRKGGNFLAVDITAIHGEADAPQKTRFDCRVNGTEARALIARLMPKINETFTAADGTTARHKVLCGFRLGDLYAETFTYTKGERAGQTGVSLKARLLRLNWVMVDGEFVYRAEAKADEAETPTEPTPQDSGDTSDATPTGATEEEVDALLPEEVSLSKDDPDFEARKAELKKKGYRFDGQAKVWRLPSQAA